MFTGSATCAMGTQYLFRGTITPQMCVIHLKLLGKIRQMCRKISKFPLRFAISGAYSRILWGIIPPSMPKRGLDHLFTYASPEIFAESPQKNQFTSAAKHIMNNTKNNFFSRHALTNVARLVAIAAVCATMSALTFAKPPIAPPIAAPATQSNAVVATIVATQLPPNFEPVLEINLNPELAPVLAPELAPALAPQLEPEQPSQSNQSSLVSASCVGDLNHDGKIDSADLGFLLTAFGSCPGCEEDLYADGKVDSADLGVLLIQFGVCPAPTVTSILPASGLASGGTTITLNGTNFFGASSVTVGGALATSVNVVSASVLTAVTPAGSIGSAVSVSVTTPGGTGTLAGAFSYYEVGTFAWASVLEAFPNADVVPDATVRAKIVASGFPWRVLDNSSGIEMLLIPSGTFTMGCSGSNNYPCDGDETNHQVTLSKAFYLGKTEVTQAQWQAKMGSNPSYFSGNANNPVEQVSWNDIVGFNTATGLRLPSEAEWEYACRGSTTTAFHSMPGYPNGTNDDSLLGNIAWYSTTFSGTTHAVAGKAANAFGMYDMSGNVFEWCNDWYNDWYGSYAAGNATDPAGPSSGSYRVLRGGGYYYDSYWCRSSRRSAYGPDTRERTLGFRVARTVDYSPPTLTAISPAYGSASGGTTITLNGTNFFGASSVTVGGALATSVNVVSATVLTAVTPAGSIGSTVSVSVTTPGGTGTLAGAFSYSTLSWATDLEQTPNATVVPDATVRAKIVASGFPWRVRDNSSGIEMLLIPGGTFNMGCSASNSYSCYSFENPTHQVTLSKAFYLGKTEVTQAQWQAKMGNNPSYFKSYSDSPSRPVEQVSWNDIVGFNTATGLRLPSEAEWEYACRGNTTTAFHSMPGYPNGTNDDSLLGNIAWYSTTFSGTTHAVAGKAANAFGMYDMSGNVFEWCNDWYESYAAGNATDPAGPSSGSYRVLRGGYWLYTSDYCRSSYRSAWGPGGRDHGIGFRVARTP